MCGSFFYRLPAKGTCCCGSAASIGYRMGRYRASELNADGVVLPQKVTAFRRTENSFPPYPIKAKAAHEEGASVFTVIIAQNGHVRSIQFLKTAYPDLAAAAMESIQHWTYKPYLVNGTPVEVQTQVTINFSMGS
jgi:TonB family protein